MTLDKTDTCRHTTRGPVKCGSVHGDNHQTSQRQDRRKESSRIPSDLPRVTQSFVSIHFGQPVILCRRILCKGSRQLQMQPISILSCVGAPIMPRAQGCSGQAVAQWKERGCSPCLSCSQIPRDSTSLPHSWRLARRAVSSRISGGFASSKT